MYQLKSNSYMNSLIEWDKWDVKQIDLIFRPKILLYLERNHPWILKERVLTVRNYGHKFQ
jgi:hypothetical protein